MDTKEVNESLITLQTVSTPSTGPNLVKHDDHRIDTEQTKNQLIDLLLPMLIKRAQ